MSLFGKILKTGFDVVTSPVAIVRDVIPGADGYIDGNRSQFAKQLEKIAEDSEEVREKIDEL